MTNRALRCLLLSASVLSSGTAFAADTPSDQSAASNTIETIVVTAEKRSELLSNVPMSITAATGEQLKNAGVTNVGDLTKIVPGFSYQPAAFSTPIYTIRGVGFYDQSLAVAPTVSVYQDQVPLPYSVMTEGAFLDVQRVEVLKGPQGTLFGENSTGGAINFIPNKPTQDFEAGLDVGYGNYNDFTADGYVSGALSDTVSARIAASTENRGDWQESETRDAGLGQRNFSTGRVLLDWDPRENLKFELNLNGWIDKSDTQAAQFVSYSPQNPLGYTDDKAELLAYKPAPNNDRVADWSPDYSHKRDDNFYQASLRADWEVSNNVTLTSISAYSGLKRMTPTDLGGTNYGTFIYTVHGAIHSFTQELRLSGNLDDNRLKWMIGGNYEKDATRDDGVGDLDDVSNSGLGPFRYHDFAVNNDQEIETKAAFASLDYDITDTLTAQGSVRYTNASADFRGCLKDPGDGGIATAISQAILFGFPIAPGQCVTLDPVTFAPTLARLSLKQDNTSWRVGLDWKPADDSLIYANITKGYKAGGFSTVPGLFVNQFDPVTQESILAYEAGVKQFLFDRSVEVTGAGFYYDYVNKQIQGTVPTAFGPLPGLVSVPKSSVKGLEANVDWKPLAGLTFGVGATYLDTTINSHYITEDPFGAAVDIKGLQFPSSPKWQVVGNVEYDFGLTDNLTGFVGAGGQYHTSSPAALAGKGSYILPSYGTLDLRAGVETDDGRWRVEVWGRNVTDEFYVTQVQRYGDAVTRLTGMPATYGATLSYHYN